MPQPEYVLRSYGGGASAAQLVQQMGSTDTSFTITPTTGWTENGTTNPLGTVGPFCVVIDDGSPSRETILCRSINLTSGLVTVFVDTDGWSGRGYDSTAAVAHVPGSSSSGVNPCWSSLEAAEANQAVFDLLGVGGSSSLGVPIGTIIPYMGVASNTPANFLVADGSALSRTTYSALYTAVTLPFTATSTAAGATLTAVGTTTVNGATVNITSLLNAGMKLQLVNSGGAIYTIQSVTTNTIVLTSGTGITAGTAGNVTVYPHGAGDGSTTFNLPDARSRVLAGQSNGVAPTNAQPALWTGGTGGESLHTLVANELAAHTHPATSTFNSSGDQVYVAPGTGTTGFNNGATFLATLTNPTVSTTVSNNSTTSSGHENKQPYLVTTHIIRVQ